MTTAARNGGSPSLRRWVTVGLAVAGLMLVAIAVWLGTRVLTVKGEYDAMLPLADEVSAAVAAADLDALDALSAEVGAHASAAAAASDDPIWRVAEASPWIGDDLQALRVVSSELDAVAASLPELVDATRSLLHPPGGVLIDPVALRAAAPGLATAGTALTDASSALNAIDADQLLPAVAHGVRSLRAVVDAAAPAVETAARAAETLPAVLGAADPQTILVMVQNTAELRTGGGITGTFVELVADDGRLSMGRQADSSQFFDAASPVADLPLATTVLYSDVVGRYVQNASMPTDFDVAATLASAWWRGLTGESPDTVVSIDPYVLRAILGVTGPLALDDGSELNADNLIDTLLVQAYRTLDADQQTSLFAHVAETVFQRLTSDAIDPLALVRALAEPVSEGRIAAWTTDAAAQALLAHSALGGPSARLDAAGDGAFGVFFNDATGAKMAGYLDVEIAAAVTACRPDGMREVTVTVTMTSTAPADVAELPMSVTGGGLFGVAVGDIGTNVSVSGPRDGFIGAVIVKGEPYPAPAVIEAGRPAAAARVNLSPGEVNTLEFSFFVPDDSAAPTVLHTPLMNDPLISIDDSGCD